MWIASRLYTSGQDRNEKNPVAHLYRGGFDNVHAPMCRLGWNRADGFGFSIWRNQDNVHICKTCMRRAEERRDPVKPKERKTKWL